MSARNEHNIAARELLLGLAGWPHPEWEGSYYPVDLPRDWQFGYYSNEADCLLLPLNQWSQLEPEQWVSWLEDAPDHFRFYLECGEVAVDSFLLQAYGAWSGALLVERYRPDLSAFAQLMPDSDGVWVDHAGVPRLVRWPSLPADLREQRALLQLMPETIETLIVDDPAASPGDLHQTRTLSELMGVA